MIVQKKDAVEDLDHQEMPKNTTKYQQPILLGV